MPRKPRIEYDSTFYHLRRNPTAVTVSGRRRDEAAEFIAAAEKKLGVGKK